MTVAFQKKAIHFDVFGEGPALVLLHGFLESSTIWQKYISNFSKNFKVVTIDLPGHGKSEVISQTHSMQLMAQCVVAVLDKLNIQTAHVMGHSMGGYVALALAEQHEERLSSIILLNSSPEEDSEARKANRERALGFLPKYTEAFVSMGISNLFTNVTRAKFAEEIEALKREALSFSEGGIEAAIRGMMHRKDRTAVLKNFSKQKIMLCGKDDPIMPFEACEQIALHTQSTFIELDGGHMGWLENFQKIEEIVSLVEKI